MEEWVEEGRVVGVVRRRIQKEKRGRERECVKEKWEGEEGKYRRQLVRLGNHWLPLSARSHETSPLTSPLTFTNIH